MEEQIKKTAASVRGTFLCFWVLPILLVVAGEMENGWTGAWADDVRAAYLTETVVILLTAVCVPVALKLFAWVMARRIDQVSLPVALRLYRRWCGVRLVLLAIPVLTGLLGYYLVLSNTGVLCACIGLTASLFCVPGEERLRRELHINKEKV